MGSIATEALAASSSSQKESNAEPDHIAQTTNNHLNKGDNKFHAAISAWRSIDLTTLIPALDKAASDLVSHQKDSLIERKELAQKTKEFRKLEDSAKLLEIKGLLKAYQSYIDLLSNQSKATHAAFLQVYSPLAEAPDPYPLLDASIDSLLIAEETLPRITEENQQLQKTVKKLTTQVEDAEKSLGQERDARLKSEAGRDERIQKVEESWTAVLNEKKDNWAAKEKSLEERLENQDRLVRELKANLAVSQRLNQGEGEADSNPRGASAAELEIVSSELDRANQRLAEVESRNEQLRLQLAQASAGIDLSKEPPSVQDDPGFLRLQSENSSLLRRLESARFEKDAEKRRWAGDVRGMEKDITNLRQDNEKLKAKITSMNDYENIKKDLEVLKSIEFATGDEDDTNANGPSLPAIEVDSTTKSAESLEQLLLARNKKLSNELTLLRVSHQSLHAQLEAMQQETSEVNAELEKSRALAATLENDLEKVQQEASNAFGSSAMSVAGTYTSRYPHSSLRRGRASSPTSSIISGFDSSGGQFTREDGVVGNAGSNMLPMITAQRDRFKRKIQDLETELQKSHNNISTLRSEVASLQKDNLNLYEKSRYVNAYRNAPAQPTTVQISSNNHTSSGMSLDSRYKSAYESSTLNPFTAFRGREAAKHFRRMTWPERAVFRTAKTVLATRLSRNLFAIYCLVLHVLVFTTVFGAGGTGSIASGPLSAAAHAAAAAEPPADRDQGG